MLKTAWLWALAVGFGQKGIRLCRALAQQARSHWEGLPRVGKIWGWEAKIGSQYALRQEKPMADGKNNLQIRRAGRKSQT